MKDMTDVDVYKFWGLLSYLDGKHKSCPDRTNYAPILLSMYWTDSIEEIMDIYNTILLEIVLLSSEEDNHHSKTIFYEIQDLREQLNYFLNICIKYLFDNYFEVTKDFAYVCLANLREAFNHDPIYHHITVNSGRIVKEYLEEANQIYESKHIVFKAPFFLTKNRDSDEYKSFIAEYETNISFLKEKGFVKSKIEIAVEKKL